MTITTLHWKSAVSGFFNVGSNWSPGASPGPSNNAFIDATGAIYTVTSSANATINGLDVDSVATLSITPGTFDVNAFADNAGQIVVGGGATLALGSSATPGANFAFQNSGLAILSSTASAAIFKVNDGIVAVRGGGEFNLSDNAHNAIVGGSLASTLVNVDNTIFGAGSIGSATLTLDNAVSGTISADDSIALTLNTGSNQILNNGTIKSTGTGGLVIDSNLAEDGTLLADGTGAVKIANGATVKGLGQMEAAVSGASFQLSNGAISFGGLLSTVAGSSILTASGTTDTLDAADFQNAGLFKVANNSTLIHSGGITNTGTISLAGATAATKLEIGTSSTSLYGAGAVVLTDTAFSKIASTGAAATLANYGNRISGSGTIGDAFLRTVNLQGGVIDSSGTAGMTLVGDTPTATLLASYNDGVLETTGSGGMTINGAWDDAGYIEAAGTGQLKLVNFTDVTGGGTVETTKSGASILLSNADIAHGVFSIAAGSVVNTAAATANNLPDDFVDAGTLNVTNSTLLLGTHAFNTGALNLTGSTSADVLKLGSSAGFTDFENGGHVTLGDTLGNSIVSNGSSQLLNNVDNTFSGFGTIGDAKITLHNDLGATIDANGTQALKINTGTNTVSNAGLIESTGSGGLAISGALYDAGTLFSSAGDLDVVGAITGLGAADVQASGEIEFGAGSDLSTHFLSGASGILRLDHSTTAADSYGGDIYGLGSTDKIDFPDVLFGAGTHFSYAAGFGHGSLMITDGTHTSTINLEGNYTAASFAIASDGHGGTFLK
jgi:hypothetical protein